MSAKCQKRTCQPETAATHKPCNLSIKNPSSARASSIGGISKKTGGFDQRLRKGAYSSSRRSRYRRRASISNRRVWLLKDTVQRTCKIIGMCCQAAEMRPGNIFAMNLGSHIVPRCCGIFFLGATFFTNHAKDPCHQFWWNVITYSVGVQGPRVAMPASTPNGAHPVSLKFLANLLRSYGHDKFDQLCNGAKSTPSVKRSGFD